MKIKRLFVQNAISCINHQTSFDSSKHSIQFIKELDAYIIDNKALVHTSQVKEVMIEIEPKQESVLVKAKGKNEQAAS